MKNLNEYIKESLLDDFDDLDKDVQQNTKKSVMKFLTDNYILDNSPISPDTKKIKISNNTNKDGKYVVDVNGNVVVKHCDIYTLTNDLFVFGKVDGFFYCCECDNLTSLKGAPKIVGMDFYCDVCNNLTSLEGGPKEVGGNFYCSKCEKLISLKGAPKVVDGHFGCSECKNLTSLKGAPEKVGGNFRCINTNITSLKGAPKEVGGNFNCNDCIKLKNLDYLPKKIGRSLYIPNHLQK